MRAFGAILSLGGLASVTGMVASQPKMLKRTVPNLVSSQARSGFLQIDSMAAQAHNITDLPWIKMTQENRTKPSPAEYEKAYDELYDNHGYHNDPDFTHEGPAIQELNAFKGGLVEDDPPLHSVVVLGCSHGKGVLMLSQLGFDSYGIDVATKAIKMASQLRGKTCRVEPCFVQGSLTRLPYPDASMDAGLSVDVLEHIAPHDVPTVVGEITRVVRHYLVLVIASFVEMSQSGEKAGMTNVHLTVEGSAWWSAQFTKHGWKVVKDSSDTRYVRISLRK